jgi:hypothetical protein
MYRIGCAVSQPLDFNWVLKVKDPVKHINVGKGTEVKGGYRVFPMSWQINLVDWNFNIYGSVRVIQTIVKHRNNITQEDALVCGFNDIDILHQYLDKEYPDSMGLVTIVSFEVVQKL